MKLSKKGMDNATMGIRLILRPHEGDKYNCKIYAIDAHRKELEIGLPMRAKDRWPEGIGFVIRTLWTSNLHCVIAIDYSQWCEHMEALDLQRLEKCLPEEFFFLRIYNVPDRSPLRQNGGDFSDVVKKTYRKKRGFLKNTSPDTIG